MYLGSMLVGDQLLQMVNYGTVVRFIALEPSGKYKVIDADLSNQAGSIMVRAITYLLESTPPDLLYIPVHGSKQFWLSWADCLYAQELMEC